MPSMEDYLDNLLKNMTDSTNNASSIEDKIEDSMEDKIEDSMEDKIEDNIESVPDMSLQESEPEYIPDLQEEIYAEESGMPEMAGDEALDVEDSLFPSIEGIDVPNIEEVEFPNIEELEASGIEELEAPGIEELEASGIEELEASGIEELEAPGIEELEASDLEGFEALDIGEIEIPQIEGSEAPETEGIETPDIEGIETPDIEGIEIPQIEESEAPETEGIETPDIEGIEIPQIEESEAPETEGIETPDIEGIEIPQIEESEAPETEEDEFQNIEEFLTGMDENIFDMDEKNLTEDMKTLNNEVPQQEDMENLNSDQVPDLSDVMEMSEDDIAQLLANGFVEEGNEDSDTSEQDVLDMLEGTDDDNLQDIQDMLQKSDNNEPVDDGIEKLLQGLPEDEEDLKEKILSEDESFAGTGPDELDALIGDPKMQKALEKKRLKEEKAAAKKAAREAAKAAKAAKKRAKKAKKKRKNKDVLDIPVENANGEELLIDIEELDRLVSKAGKIGDEESEPEDDENVPGNAEENDLGLDLGNLFADDGGSEEDPLQALETTETDEQSDSRDLQTADDKKKEKREKTEKTGFLAKILSFLMEEDDEEDEKKENLRLSEENQGILNDLDKQGKTVKGGKGGTGGKKDKKKEAKKEKPKKEAKPKKAPKPKKEKPPKEPEPYVPPKKRLTPKKVLPVVLLGITVTAALLIFVNITTDYVDKRAAKTAYYDGDYATCYQNLNGKELNETEAVMYGRSESILYIRMWYREYEMFVEEGSEVEALDSLIQTVKDYPMLYEYASKWNAEGDVYAIYADILNILLDKYGITELQAKEIAKEWDDYEYTRMVIALAEGRPYGSWNQPSSSGEDDSLPHELPEESGLGQGDFVDNR